MPQRHRPRLKRLPFNCSWCGAADVKSSTRLGRASAASCRPIGSVARPVSATIGKHGGKPSGPAPHTHALSAAARYIPSRPPAVVGSTAHPPASRRPPGRGGGGIPPVRCWRLASDSKTHGVRRW